MVKKATFNNNEQAARAISKALVRFANIIRDDDMLFRKYHQRYLLGTVEETAEMLLQMADNNPVYLLRRVETLEEQFKAYKNNLEKTKGTAYERIIKNSDISEAGRQRPYKAGKTRS